MTDITTHWSATRGDWYMAGAQGINLNRHTHCSVQPACGSSGAAT